MPRNLRVEFPGAIYHITVRGNGRQAIYRDNRDRKEFIGRLAETAETYGIRLYLYCLMTDHYHLLLETPKANLSQFMQCLGTGHTVFFNKRHQTVGHLYQGRFGARLVEGDEYLLKLSRYVHLNPVRVKGREKRPLRERVEYLRSYIWSSYRSYIGKDREPGWLVTRPVLGQVGGRSEKRWRKEYRKYVESGLVETDKEFSDLLKSSMYMLGSEDFQRRIEDMAEQKAKSLKRPDDVRFRQTVQNLSVNEIIEVVARVMGLKTDDIYRRQRGTNIRAVAADILLKFSGLSRRDLSEVLGLKSGAGMSWQVQKLGRLIVDDRNLWQTLHRIEKELRKRANA